MSTATESLRNDYLEQVVRQKSQLENDLKARRAPMVYNPAPAGAQARIAADEIGFDELDRSGGAVGSSAVDVRVSGFWRWKNVVVPPNAYVVHTRRGHEQPVHLGLGVSFRFNLMGYAIMEAYLAHPFQRPKKNWVWGFQLAPGW